MKIVDPQQHSQVPLSPAEQQACAALDRSVDELHAALALRLQQQRQALLSQPRQSARPWRPAMAMAASLLLGLSIWLLQPYSTSTTASHPVASKHTGNTAMPELPARPNGISEQEWSELTRLSREEWDMLQDLDFALWLSELPDDSLLPAPMADQAG